MARKVHHHSLKGERKLLKQIELEIQALHKCRCPYVLGFYECIIEPDDKRLTTYTEYMDGRNLEYLYRKVGEVPEDIVGMVTLSLLKAMEHLSKLEVLSERDIRPSNIFVNSFGHVKIWDFLDTKVDTRKRLSNYSSIKCYMCPSRLQGLSNYSIVSSIWSLGISLSELAIGRYPYLNPSKVRDSMSIFELLDIIVSEEPPKLPQDQFSSLFCDFVDRCLRKNPTERGHLKELLQHEWVLKIKSEKDTIDFTGFISNAIALYVVN